MMSNPWEGFLSGTYVPDTEEDFSTWGEPSAVYFPFSATFSEDEEESDAVEEFEAVCESPRALAPEKSRFSLFRRLMHLNRTKCKIVPTVENKIANFHCYSLLYEEKWDDVVRYNGPESPASKLSRMLEESPKLLKFMQILLSFPDYWRSIADDKRQI
ncbi:uncharacterized protein LOC130988960 [Salvia miltiorrhiza]|uniref:uncharacterized protein LOC130988960 n=1 Tax=Salvia miltiorrhiza TaxID=226208 RepID=UPI0025AC65C9|nr:uncharacterized protein LOC130988960 [Salvia miltiorrhiza]